MAVLFRRLFSNHVISGSITLHSTLFKYFFNYNTMLSKALSVDLVDKHSKMPIAAPHPILMHWHMCV